MFIIKISKVKGILLFSAVILLITVLYDRGYGFTPIGIENEEFKVKLVKAEKIRCMCQFDTEYTFRSYDKLTGQDSVIKMRNMTTVVSNMQITKKRLIVFGAVGNIASGVTVIDLEDKKETDFIICYRPQLSETKKYLAYEKFYPRFAPEEIRSSVIMVYDTEKSPLSNRSEDEIRKKDLSVGGPGYLLYSENVGNPVCPKGSGNKKKYFVRTDSSVKSGHAIISDYLWIEQDKKIIFIDRYGNEIRIVSVNLHKGLSNTDIQKKVTDITKILDISPKIPNYDELIETEKQRLRIKSLEQGKHGKLNINIRLYQNGKYKTTELETDFPSVSD